MSKEVWKMVRLREVGKVVTGKTPSSTSNGMFGSDYPFITPGDIDGSSMFNLPAQRSLSQNGMTHLSKIALPRETICVVCIGSTIGKICLTRETSATNQQINSIVVAKGISNRFLLYRLKLLQEFIAMIGTSQGSGVPILNKTAFEKLQLSLPPLPTQRKIASILSAYDDLIENNRKRIALLEQMAAGLYKEWFVRWRVNGVELEKDTETGLPLGWEVKRLGELYKTGSGGTPSRLIPEFFAQKGFNWVKTGELLDSFIFETEEKIAPIGLKNSSAKLCPIGTVIIAMYGATIGQLGILASEAATNQACCTIIPKNEEYTSAYIYFTLIIRRQELINVGFGAAQQNISQDEVKRFLVLKPELGLLKEFSVLANSLLDKIRNLQLQNTHLRTTRDRLLPRLMSDELSVSHLPEVVAM
jgi:type I restriction enzyme, S subunit